MVTQRLFLSSIFRDAERYIPRYVAQLDALAQLVAPTTLHVVVAEGDNMDDTADVLRAALDVGAFKSTVLTVNHGGPWFPSIADPVRWKQIAKVCNAVMEEVSPIIFPDEHFIYVESDLIWQAPHLAMLLADLGTYPAVAPMSLTAGHYYFYDTWGHRKDGQRFSREPPYHPALAGVHEDRYVEIDSAGSCIAMRGHLVPDTRFSPEDCILGVGRSLREAGASLWLDTEAEVIHP